MTSQGLVSQYQFIPLDRWVEVGRFILGKISKEEMPNRSLPEGTVVCAMRFCGDPALLDKIGYGLPKGKSDVVYVGYSTKLGVENSERLYNMGKNGQPTNKSIRKGMAEAYGLPSGRVEIGWREVKDEDEAKRFSRQVKAGFRNEHGRVPPFNR